MITTIYIAINTVRTYINSRTYVAFITFKQFCSEQPKSTSGQPSLSVSNPQKPLLPMKGELH